MLPVFLATAAVTFILISRWLRALSGMPAGSITYRDSGREASVLRSDRYGLVGKPDYLLHTRGGLIPVEIKPARRQDRPHRSDLLQLAAYCLLTEDTQPSFGGYGILRAGNASIRVPFTPDLRAELIDTLDEMRTLLADANVAPSHSSAARCRACCCRQSCGSAISETNTWDMR